MQGTSFVQLAQSDSLGTLFATLFSKLSGSGQPSSASPSLTKFLDTSYRHSSSSFSQSSATTLFGWRDARQFDRANALEILLERLGGIDADLSKSVQDALVLLFALEGHQITDKQRRLIDATTQIVLHESTLNVLDSQASLLLPSKHDLRYADSKMFDAEFSVSYPFYVQYTDEVFEKKDFGSDQVDLWNDPVDLDGYSRERKDSLFYAVSHGSSVTAELDTPIELSLPDLPAFPNDILQSLTTPSYGYSSLKSSTSPSRSLADSGYGSSKEISIIWDQVGQEDDVRWLPLGGWESFETTRPEANRFMDTGASKTHRTPLMPSPFVTEADRSVFGAIYESIYFNASTGRDVQKQEVLSDERLLRDALNVVVGVTSETFTFDSSAKTLQVKPEIWVRGETFGCESTRSVLNDLALCGSRFRSLEDFVNRVQSDPPSHGLTAVALAQSLSSYLGFVRSCVVRLPEMLGPRFHLIEIYCAVEPIKKVMEMLTEFLSTRSDGHSKLPRGTALLSYLYEAAAAIDMTQNDKLLRALILSLLSSTSWPFFRWLDARLGIVREAHDADDKSQFTVDFRELDPYLEFFIVDLDPAETLETTGDSFWSGGFQLSESTTPPTFIPEVLAQGIIRAGKALRLLQSSLPSHPIFKSSTQGISYCAWTLTPSQVDGMRLVARELDEHVRSATQDLELEGALDAEKVEVEIQLWDTERRNEARSETEAMSLSKQMQAEKVQQRKRVLQQSIEAFLTQRSDEKESARSKELDEDARLIARRLQENEEWQRLKEDEQRDLVARYETAMDALNRRQEVAEWRRLRLELDDKRRALLTEDAPQSLVPGSSIKVSTTTEPINIPETGSTDADTSMADSGDDFVDAVENHDEEVPYQITLNQDVSVILSLEEQPLPSRVDEKDIDNSSSQPLESPHSSPDMPVMQSSLMESPIETIAPLNDDVDHEEIPAEVVPIEVAPAEVKVDELVIAPPSHTIPTISPSVDVTVNAVQKLFFDLKPLSPLNLNEHTVPSQLCTFTSMSLSFPNRLDELLTMAESDNQADLVINHTPLPTLVQDTLHYALQTRINSIEHCVIRFLLHGAGLQAHLEVLKSFLLLSDGMFRSSVKDAIFVGDGGSGVGINGCLAWPPAGLALLAALNDVVVFREAERCGFVSSNGHVRPKRLLNGVDKLSECLRFVLSETEQDIMDPAALEALDFLNLAYTPPPPINIIITPSIVQNHYQKCFWFLLRLARTDEALSRITNTAWWKDHRSNNIPSDIVTVVVRFRFEAAHFVRGLIRYSFDVGVETPWKTFMDEIERVKHIQTLDLESLYLLHITTMDEIVWRLLLHRRQAPIMKCLSAALQTILTFSRLITGRVTYTMTNENVVDLFKKFRMSVGLFVMGLSKLVEKDTATSKNAKKRDMRMFSELLANIDNSGYFAKSAGPYQEHL
ncbi:hypothetical protein SmJEL517_g02139 [Synchytrium microbalum]|uniref:Gamma tubulin complex component C-terminal domain-containing protein n=1 Tax=Synchytrium microbalum TaxID=1806994 RepID=A0A507C1W3_9FUNG|nr:uncharacterized protein SmJEL517_g02139 [Synchytrium microbalum]TPX35520.1 hypothetical protein SmJEL517_g02139 [Synchytrium microbalum]